MLETHPPMLRSFADGALLRCAMKQGTTQLPSALLPGNCGMAAKQQCLTHGHLLRASSRQDQWFYP